MATGTGIPQSSGIETSRATPDVDLSTGAAAAYQGLARLGETVNETVINPALERIAVRKGAEQGAALAQGEGTDRVLGWGEIADARRRAVDSAYIAGTRNDIDARLAAARREHAFDPEGFEAKSREIVSGFIQGAPPRYAVAVEQYAQGRAADNFQVVANERVQRDQQEVVSTLNARSASLSEDLVAMGANGQFGSDDYARTLLELQDVQRDLADNPIIAYTPEQAQVALDKTLDGVQVAVLGRAAVDDYAAAGGGIKGRAAAYRTLDDEYAKADGIFAGLAPARRLSLLNSAKKQVDARYAVDREETRAQDEAERAANAARRDRRGELSLLVATGGATREMILGDELLDDGDKAALIRSQEAAARTAAAAGRAALALERAGRAQTYAGLKDDARAGTLDPATLADHVNAGLIEPGQARTLAAMNDKTLKPVIEGAMAPYRDMARRPGMSMRATKVQEAKAESEAASWARQNPNATLEQQLQAGGMLAKKYFGAESAPTAASGSRPEIDDRKNKVVLLKQLDAQKSRMSDAQYRERRKAILRGE